MGDVDRPWGLVTGGWIDFSVELNFKITPWSRNQLLAKHLLHLKNDGMGLNIPV
jgi:hypothetical protein